MLRFMRAFLFVFVLTLASSTGAQDTTATATYLSLSPDGAYAAYVENGVLQVGGTATWQAVPVPESAKSGVQALAWHPDSTMLAVGTEKSDIIVFAVGEAEATRAASDAEPIAVLYHPDVDPEWGQFGVQNIGWSPDGRYLATNTAFGPYQLILWDTLDWTESVTAKIGNAWSLRWSPMSNEVVVSGGMGIYVAQLPDTLGDSLAVLDFSAWSEVSRYIVERGQDDPFSYKAFGALAWTPDGSRVLSASVWGELWVFDILSGEARQFGRLDPVGEGSFFFVVRDIVYDEERGIAYTAVSSQDITQNLTRIMAWDVANGVLLNTIEVQARVVQFDLDPATGEPVFAATFAPADAPAPRDVPLGFRAPG